MPSENCAVKNQFQQRRSIKAAAVTIHQTRKSSLGTFTFTTRSERQPYFTMRVLFPSFDVISTCGLHIEVLENKQQTLRRQVNERRHYLSTSLVVSCIKLPFIKSPTATPALPSIFQSLRAVR